MMNKTEKIHFKLKKSKQIYVIKTAYLKPLVSDQNNTN